MSKSKEPITISLFYFSKIENRLTIHYSNTSCKKRKIPYFKEAILHDKSNTPPKYRWRFDIVIPAINLIIEKHGGAWSGDRHVRGNGFANDCQKMRFAQLLGWNLFAYSTACWNTNDYLTDLETLLQQPHA